jgi:hypothetical protein
LPIDRLRTTLLLSHPDRASGRSAASTGFGAQYEARRHSCGWGFVSRQLTPQVSVVHSRSLHVKKRALAERRRTARTRHTVRTWRVPELTLTGAGRHLNL